MNITITKVSYKQYTFNINSTTIIDKKFELPSEAKKVTGIRLDSPDEVLLATRGSCRIELSNRELFPEEFPARFLQFGREVPADQRMHTLDEVLTAFNLKIRFQDQPAPSSPALVPYSVTIIVRYEV
ncbi:hypothetical protein WAF17_02480 [Bernardetia sp. ABR2-2B]|uniref:hypothetical protein n=1 Tax=Bernardetia sp. ABR2-2B TaxID=3127472 RepID=UPI0030D39A93